MNITTSNSNYFFYHIYFITIALLYRYTNISTINVYKFVFNVWMWHKYKSIIINRAIFHCFITTLFFKFIHQSFTFIIY